MDTSAIELRRRLQGPAIEYGRRVWVVHPDFAGCKAFGRIATVSVFSYADTSFTVVLEVGGVVRCTEAARGAAWDFVVPSMARGVTQSRAQL